MRRDLLGRRIDSKASTGAIENTLRDYVNVYTYDTLSRLMSIAQNKQGSGTGYDSQIDEKRADFVYNALGQTQRITRYRDVSGATEVAHSDYEYDKFGRLAGLDHEKSDNSVITSYAYTFDHLNRVTGVDMNSAYNAEDSTYAYDATDQLIGVDRSALDEAYVHDLNGNRRMAGATNYSVSANNQLANDGTYTYQYDDEGNRTKRTKISDSTYVDYVFDHRNRLTQAISKNSGGTVTQQVDYIYDAFDRLVMRTLDADGAGGGAAADEFFVYDGHEVALRFDGAGSLTKRYVNGPAADQALAEEQLANSLGGANRVYWALTDHLGTVRDVINQGAVLKNHITYDAFGRITAETVPSIDFLYGFQGLLRDEATGLYLTKTRWYDPLTGKWMQEDWIGFAGGDTNLGRFVNNSPTNAVDPTGMESEDPNLPGWKPSVGPSFRNPPNTYTAKFVAKSFISGIPRVGVIVPDRDGLPLPNPLFPGILTPLDRQWPFATATERLQFFAEQVKNLPPFNQNPDRRASKRCPAEKRVAATAWFGSIARAFVISFGRFKLETPPFTN